MVVPRSDIALVGADADTRTAVLVALMGMGEGVGGDRLGRARQRVVLKVDPCFATVRWFGLDEGFV